jgi:hypothetical protein
MKLWILREDVNEYDQPPNNLAAIWTKKPSIETLLEALGFSTDLTALHEDELIRSVSVLKGESVRINNADYKLEQVEEGRLP